MPPTPISPISRLFGSVSTFEGRIGISIVLLGVLALAAWGARRLRLRIGDGEYTRVANAAVAAGMLVVAAILGTAVLAVWNVSILALFNDPTAIQAATRIAVTIVLILGTYLLTEVVEGFVRRLTEDQEAITQHQTELIFRTTQVSLYVLAAIIVFGVWSVNLGGLLVGAGFLGIVVGLAARQTLGALIAGFVLMFARPFEIGDWVEIGDRDGIVTEISIVNTRIQTFDGEYVMIPNDVVGSSEIVNRTRKGRLRIHLEVGVDYTTDVEHAAEVARDAMKDVDEILTVPQPQVVVTEFGASAITLDCRFWIDKPSARRRARAQTAVIKAVKTAFDREDIKIPFPQRELSGRAETGGFKVASEDVPVEVTPDGGDGDGDG